ncbi:TPA: WxcM-like domain-containing protein [Citrobacter freundii]|uniref:sugar 3,4-ketoisomerase n=1 Tax=Citrobacter TaxID=544 RepID=UPI0018912786|nr:MULTISPECIES: FdtA/QdtA family cupin domain-containing protein [Citrobacter]MCR3708038.1 FdtA/QdtA family cupin domain-containing protein [Citrobacter freundii]MCY3449900.1 WxcM-like domain-containing protein [Citrobacter freundii]MDM3162557.1 FdtA/QdtA family cupin domain-containing protein [Citrobacter sp. Cf118]MDM3222991.1 FdtA/QdtA family cupin domain-containing protein [Citrobacter sp. Cf088]MEB1072077.1 FdtA/QdtA family cupin domain-containing protein [Citrobacter freundii]
MDLQLIPLQKHGDARGLLVALEEQRNIPFEIKRIYYIFDTLQGVRRGFHAHKATRQVAVVARGSCKFHMDNGKHTEELELSDPAVGLLIEPYVWHEMYDFSEDCILMVIASDYYNEEDYIRDYDDFMRMIDDNEYS